MRRNYLNFVAIIGLAASVAVLPACNKKEGCTDINATNYDPDADTEDGTCNYETTGNGTELSGTITSDKTLASGEIWFLNGRVVVENGATLTIEAGTIIKGKVGAGNSASALIIAKGGKIVANGTATQPIIFTSELDNIALGQKVGTNLFKTDNEKWGGLILLPRLACAQAVVTVEPQTSMRTTVTRLCMR